MGEQAKYTQGPWEARYETGDASYRWRVYGPPDHWGGRVVANVFGSSECEQGNARLIAAAPQLKYACDSLLDAIKDQSNLMAKLSSALRLAEVAVAKADGKELQNG
jgi:hypothetical protein